MAIVLADVDEVEERAQCTHDTRSNRRVSINARDDLSLNVSLLPASVLVEASKSGLQMAKADAQLRDFESPVQLCVSDQHPDPLNDVIHKEFMPVVEYIGHKKFARVCVLPSSPERLNDAVQTDQY